MIIITGISGYIGGQIALKLKDQGHQVVGVDLRPLPEHLACLLYTSDAADE